MNTILQRIVKSIPNTLTLMNLTCGLFAIMFALELNFEMVFWAVIASALFDFLDGAAARLLKAYSAIGADLDSLSDMVSFGVVPGMVIYSLLLGVGFSMPWLGFIVTLFAALRLAKFNNDTRQGEEFRGLAVPAATLVVVGVAMAYSLSVSCVSGLYSNAGFMGAPWFLLLLTVLISGLMVCDIPMFSLKFKSLKFADNKLRYGFLILSLLLVLAFGWVSPALVVTLYVLLSIFLWLKKR